MTAATTAPTPEQRAYAIVQPLTVEKPNLSAALVARIAAAIRQHSEALEARATTAEAALAAMDPANPDWREVAMSNGKALGERNAAWDRLNAELAASQARETVMREALKEAMRLVEEYGCRTDVAHIADDCDAAVAMCRAAIQPQEPANVRDALPTGHVVLEQAEMMDGRVSQTVRHQNGTEYQRIVSAEEACGDDDQ
ncbi:hypothetical protein [Azospirillum palustre]